MTGIPFERATADALRDLGWEAELTKSTPRVIFRCIMTAAAPARARRGAVVCFLIRFVFGFLMGWIGIGMSNPHKLTALRLVTGRWGGFFVAKAGTALSALSRWRMVPAAPRLRRASMEAIAMRAAA
jgi:hypothetical protein